jgi:predicted nucleic acid-binding protein
VSPALFLLDNNAYDPLTVLPERYARVQAACEAGQVVLLLTHVQRDEIAANPNVLGATWGERAGERVADLVLGLPHVDVPTHGFVTDISRFDAMAFSDEGTVEAARGEGLAHSRDALLLTTAQQQGAVLVTYDRRLRRRAAEVGADVWTPERFIAYVDGLTASEAS